MLRFLTAPLLLTACGLGDGALLDPYHSDILPREDKVRINLPGGDASAKDEGTRADYARYYVVTRSVTENVNGLITAILGTVNYVVTTQEPSWSDADSAQAIWGPYSDNPLDPVEVGVWVREEDDGGYTWAVFFVPNGGTVEDDAVAVVIGEVDAGATSEEASGLFVADFTTASSLDPAWNLTGTFSVEYAYDAAGVAAVAGFDDYGAWMAEQRYDAVYAYDQAYGGGGEMDLAWLEDVVAGGDIEVQTMKSRWDADGQGRSDAAIGGGDLGDEVVTANECWDTSFEAIYWYDSIGYYEAAGTEDLCAFSEASYATEASFTMDEG